VATASAGVVSNGPPTSIAPSELFLAIQKRPRAFRIVDFPRLDGTTGKSIGQIAMCPLLQQELIEAKAEAVKLGKALTKDSLDPKEYILGHEQIYQELCGCEILFRACRVPTDIGVTIFKTSADVRKLLTSDEVAVLIQSYAIAQLEIGPLVSMMSDVERDAWLKRLGEGATAIPLALLSLEQVRALLMHSASRLLTLQTANGSAGQPADESMSTEPNLPEPQ
jgi:hypothetical protein